MTPQKQDQGASSAGDALEILFEGRVAGAFRRGGAEFGGGIGEASLFFEDEAELPVGGGLGGRAGLGLLGKVPAEIALGTVEAGVGFQQGQGGGVERGGVVRKLALRLVEGGIQVASVLLVGG